MPSQEEIQQKAKDFFLAAKIAAPWLTQTELENEAQDQLNQ